MVWALLALLGVPVWLVVGMLGGALWSRRRFRQQDGVFKVAMRPADATAWKRLPGGYARRFSNVLVINSGLALVRTRIHVVQRVEPASLDDGAPRGFGDPASRLLQLDDGTALGVVAERSDIAEIDLLAVGADPPRTDS